MLKQAPMADYCSLTIDCIDFVQDKVQGRHGTTLQLNECQCKYLADEALSKVKSVLQVKGLQSNLNRVHDIRSEVLPHLHATAMRAKMLVESCCCGDSSWLVAAMKLADITEDVIAITLDLYQWTFLLDVAIAAVNGAFPESLTELLKTGEEHYQRLWRKLHSKDDNNVLQNAALEDQKNLLLKIAEAKERHIGEEDQQDGYIRAVHLESRLNHTEEEIQDVKELQDYTIARDLGKGAAGMVLEVSWLGHQCALKILSVIDKHEATVLNGVQHPNVVSLFHYWEVQSDLKSYIVMELMPIDLHRHIELKRQQSSSTTLQGGKPIDSKMVVTMPFSLPVAIDIMLQVAEGMRYLHVNQKMTHRDLKTPNILVKPVSESTSMELHNQGYLEVKLADFGLAKVYASSSISETLTRNAGTSVYGAPEIFGKDLVPRMKNFPPKADVWSFGMTCSEILTGEGPFANEPRVALHGRISKDGLRPILPHDCPEYLQFCIRSCWELQPERRPSFSDICRLLRHAKFLSLGLVQFEINSCFFAYVTRAGIFNILRNSISDSSIISRLAQSIWEMVGLGGVQKMVETTLSGRTEYVPEDDFDGMELAKTAQEDVVSEFHAPTRTPEISPLHVPHDSLDSRSKEDIICVGCEQRFGIHERPMSCIGKTWHPNCFCCKLCNKPIANLDSECLMQGINAYHHECYKDLYKKLHEDVTRIASHYDYDDLELARTTQEGVESQSNAKAKTLDISPLYVPHVSSELRSNTDSTICVGCGKQVGDKHLLSCKGRFWHPNCFRCYLCNKLIADSEFSVQESKAYHRDCYKELHKWQEGAPRIASEFNPDRLGLTKRTPQDSGGLYSTISMQGDSNFQFDASPRTSDTSPIFVPPVRSDLRIWHPKCLSCNLCNKPIANHEFSVQESKAYHRDCYKKLHKWQGAPRIASEFNPDSLGMMKRPQEDSNGLEPMISTQGDSNFQFDAPPRTLDIVPICVPPGRSDLRSNKASTLCARCDKQLGNGRLLTCLGKDWHPNCFCCNLCNKPIADPKV